MPRNATAIALKIYFSVILGFMLIGTFPTPLSLEMTHPIYKQATVIFSLGGCLISLVGILWPRTRRKEDRQGRAIAVLDGSVIEQGGLLLAALGMIMMGASIIPLFPMGFFTMACCGGFAVAFVSQWYLIKRWRANLRKQAKSGPLSS